MGTSFPNSKTFRVTTNSATSLVLAAAAIVARRQEIEGCDFEAHHIVNAVIRAARFNPGLVTATALASRAMTDMVKAEMRDIAKRQIPEDPYSWGFLESVESFSICNRVINAATKSGRNFNECIQINRKAENWHNHGFTTVISAPLGSSRR